MTNKELDYLEKIKSTLVDLAQQPESEIVFEEDYVIIKDNIIVTTSREVANRFSPEDFTILLFGDREDVISQSLVFEDR